MVQDAREKIFTGLYFREPCALDLGPLSRLIPQNFGCPRKRDFTSSTCIWAFLISLLVNEGVEASILALWR